MGIKRNATNRRGSVRMSDEEKHKMKIEEEDQKWRIGGG